MRTMRRISVVGTSGSGKTTLAQGVSRRLGVPHVELDAIHHLPGWTPIGDEEFRAVVAERIARETWVIDGNYRGKLGDLVWSRADTVLWLDLPRPLIMAQLIRRTAARVLTGRELWNGNREHWRNMVSRDPQRSIIVFAWQSHPRNRARYLAAQSDPAYRDITFIRLRTHRDIAAFLARLGGADGRGGGTGRRRTI
ncbi:adenylate kinase family enzyme [Nocardia sp. GAS34]|uniref:hypothetical protein n=1 Tax=unclassified Nocardia TaxID=2637762 RepID=UPI003D24FA05